MTQFARIRRTAVLASATIPETAQPPALCDVLAPLADAADFVLGLDREGLRDAESLRPGEADIHVLKSRHSPMLGPVTVTFQGHYARFVDLVS